MKIQISILIITLVLLIASVSCKSEKQIEVDESLHPIVTVFDQTLYKSDLAGVTSYGMSPEDSTVAAEAYIKAWINERLVYNIAEENITEREDIDALVEDYRKSLIMNKYISILLKERLSESVEDSELLMYFNDNKDRFDLKENIIRGLFLKIPKESSQVDNFKKWYRQETDEAIENIEKNKLQNLVAYENFSSSWVSFNDVSDNIPYLIDNEETFFKNNKTLEVSDSSFVYLLNIKEYKLAGSEPPFDYVKEYLKESYLEERRESYLKELQDDLYNNALSKDKILYYNK